VKAQASPASLFFGGRAATELAFPERAARDTAAAAGREEMQHLGAGSKVLGMRYGRPVRAWTPRVPLEND
jgi:hypothetical protein